MSIQNKNAETVADAIFKKWFCQFGIPAQIHTDGGKEFVNKLATEMMEFLNVAPHQDVTSAPTMQFTSRSVQQNRIKILGIVCQQHGFKLETSFITKL